MNYFRFLFVLTILEVWLIVCLQFRFSFQFLFFCFLNFTLSAIVSCGRNRINIGDDDNCLFDDDLNFGLNNSSADMVYCSVYNHQQILTDCYKLTKHYL